MGATERLKKIFKVEPPCPPVPDDLVINYEEFDALVELDMEGPQPTDLLDCDTESLAAKGLIFLDGRKAKLSRQGRGLLRGEYPNHRLLPAEQL